MLKIGITGKSGFLGTHLFNYLGLFSEKYTLVPFNKFFFTDESLLKEFVSQCDIIVHFAALSRHPEPNVVYETNIKLVKKLISAMESENVTPHVLFSSSIQEESDNEYGNSKLLGRQLFEQWASRNNSNFTGMLFPNVYGPFGKPNYVSFIATFCYKLIHNETPEVFVDSSVKLIYVGNLVRHIINKIDSVDICKESQVDCHSVPFDCVMKVTEVLQLLKFFKNSYLDQDIMPKLLNDNDLNLFNTFHSYINHRKYFPRRLIQHSESKGCLIEVNLGVDGQLSTLKKSEEILIGNNFHTQKIKRFTVINGNARLQTRRIGADEVLSFYLKGEESSYVDIPIWHTHNISNVGNEKLEAQFEINENYNPNQVDTYFESV